MIKIKVCGMTQAGNVKELTQLNPDYIGFIFYPASKRYIGEHIPTEILEIIPATIKKVGVFVNVPLEEIKHIIRTNQLDGVQLHGEESIQYCRSIKETGVFLIKTFGIGDQLNQDLMAPYTTVADYFLFDKSSADYGGTGKKFNWDLLKQYTLAKPVILSGGISPEDMDQLNTLHYKWIHGIDLNSRFENSPGIKNIEHLRKFFEKVRS